MRLDALIVGAGMSGLAAGIRIAQSGRRVAILERHYLWGGLNSFYKLGGRLFDSGLHALTNFTPRSERQRPLGRILRALRIPWEALELGEQSFSEIAFPGVRLAFANDLELLRSEVARAFPGERDGLERLLAELPDYADVAGLERGMSARERLRRYFDDPLLGEMLLCPVAYYGSAREGDVDWDQFAVLFRSIFLEGFARPAGGIRALLKLLVDRFEAEGGELRLQCGVARVVHEDGRASGVVLDDGSELEADEILSSAGRVETARLCGEPRPAARAGRLSFFENLCVLDREPAALGHLATVTFFNASPHFGYRCPDAFTDPESGVISTPNNFARAVPLPEGLVRVTVLADPARWKSLERGQYERQKELESSRALASAVRFVPDFRPHVVFTDTFTPSTIERFTGHANGAVYGSPDKLADGATDIANLHLIGTDQGLVGIVGALLSGITVANRVALEVRAPRA